MELAQRLADGPALAGHHQAQCLGGGRLPAWKLRCRSNAAASARPAGREDFIEGVTAFGASASLSSRGTDMTDNEPTGARQAFGHIAPKLAEVTDKVVFGDIWRRSEL